jgi:hypothetical protein
MAGSEKAPGHHMRLPRRAGWTRRRVARFSKLALSGFRRCRAGEDLCAGALVVEQTAAARPFRGIGIVGFRRRHCARETRKVAARQHLCAVGHFRPRQRHRCQQPAVPIALRRWPAMTSRRPHLLRSRRRYDAMGRTSLLRHGLATPSRRRRAWPDGAGMTRGPTRRSTTSPSLAFSRHPEPRPDTSIRRARRRLRAHRGLDAAAI